jgi:hypothetical protein
VGTSIHQRPGEARRHLADLERDYRDLHAGTGRWRLMREGQAARERNGTCERLEHARDTAQDPNVSRHERRAATKALPALEAAVADAVAADVLQAVRQGPLPKVAGGVATINESGISLLVEPGELRTSQNWIGPPGATIETATFVPPPPGELNVLLGDLERFVHEEPLLPPLVQAALVHYQFETIHPFLDGNGRLGRLLIVFLLVLRDRLPAPLLCLSPYFEHHRQEYYDALQSVRERGDIDQWLALFLDAVRVQATDAVARAETLTDLRERYRSTVRSATRGIANQVAELALEQPILASRVLEARLGISRPAALKALRQLERLGILTESAGGPRRQLRWRAHEVLAVLTDE